MLNTLEKINQEVKKCTKCSLGKTRQNAVPGEGDPKSEIMFIGEGPGGEEDKQGRPFVGSAGQLLNELLASINLKREDVYIANLIKCRPPNNRDPLPEEMQACWPYLEAQIKIIKPKLIITLGRHAMGHFIPGRKISEIHGQPKRLVNQETGEKQVYCPIYHPAAALYHGSLKETLFKDFRRIPKVLEKI